MAVIKRIIKVFVAVTTIFCVLAATVLPVFAANSDDVVNFIDHDGDIVFTIPEDEFDLSDYAIAYDDYLYFKSHGTTFNAAAGVLEFSNGIAWSSVFAELGKVCSSGGLYFLGYALLGGALVYAADGFWDIIVNDAPELFSDIVSLIYMNSDASTRAWLEEAFNLYYEGEPITIPASVSQNIADVINGLNLRDESGNPIDTAIAISTAYIGGVMADTHPDKLSVSGDYADGITANDLILFEGVKRTDTVTSSFCENEQLSWYVPGKVGSGNPVWSNLTNKITGTTITFDMSTIHINYQDFYKYMTDFFMVECANGASYWLTYISEFYYPDRYSGKGYIQSAKPVLAPSQVSAEYPITISNSGTILDGKTITSVTWDEVNSTWIYEGLNDFKTAFPLDPLGLVISSTGAGATAGNIGTVAGNEEDKNIFVSPIPFVPSIKDKTIGIPISNTLLQDATTAFEQDVAVDDTITFDEDLTLDDPDKLMDFLGGLANYFDGLFDWLPDDFRDRLDGVMRTLTGLICAMALVKIIDIIWP